MSTAPPLAVEQVAELVAVEKEIKALRRLQPALDIRGCQ
jgi:hypothetical protein